MFGMFRQPAWGVGKVGTVAAHQLLGLSKLSQHEVCSELMNDPVLIG